MTSKYFSQSIALKVFLASVVCCGGLMLAVPVARAETCAFTRDLSLGVTGEDVRCLQQYLNNNGFAIASTGPGSPGNETGEFKALTEAALKRWQEAKAILPATGTFGPRSRALYRTEQGGGGTVLGAATTSASVVTGIPSLQAIMTRLAALERRVEALEGKKSGPTTGTAKPTPVTPVGSKAEQAAKVLRQLEDSVARAKKEIADADDDGERVDVAEELLDEVRDMVATAEDLYDDKNYDRVLVLTKRAQSLVAEAVDAIGKRSGDDDDDEDEQEELEERLDDLRDELDEARDDFDDAVADGASGGDAEDLLDEADDLLDDAEEAIDDQDFSDAEDLLDDAEDLIEEARDEF
jgi:peptidoglycan hydrolase-like protein with peptidoglycan-binding domain